MEVEESLKKYIWPQYLSALNETKIDKWGVINRNLSCALASNIDQHILEKFQIQSKKWLQKYLASNLGKQSLALFGGMCDLTFSFWRMNNIIPQYGKELAALNEIIYTLLEQRISIIASNVEEIVESDFDVISGLAGIISYCFLNEKVYHDLNSKIIEIFISKTNSDTGWAIANKKLDLSYRKRFPNGYINLSMSHGILGPLIAMCQAYSRGYAIAGLKEAIQKLLLLYRKLYDEKRRNIPCIVDVLNTNNNIFFSRNSWSYGTATIFFSLMKASKIVGDHKLYHEYKKILIENLLVGEKLNKYECISPMLVNGYGGLLCLLKRLQEEDNMESLANQIKKLEKHLINMYDKSAIFGFKHYEYRCGENNVWYVEAYELEGLSHGTLGMIVALQGDKDLIKSHLLLY